MYINNNFYRQFTSRNVTYALDLDPLLQHRIFIGDEQAFSSIGFTLHRLPSAPYAVMFRINSAGQPNTTSAPPTRHVASAVNAGQLVSGQSMANAAPVTSGSASASRPIDVNGPAFGDVAQD